MKVIKTHTTNKLEDVSPNLTSVEKHTLQYALAAYSYVLPRTGEFTAQEWANAIRLTLDEKEPRNALVLTVIATADKRPS